jgi:transposase
MSKTIARVFSREFKHDAVRRMEAGENVSALARELSVRRKLLYQWRDALRSGGPAGLRGRGRPRKSEASGPPSNTPPPGRPASAGTAAALARIAELERKVGQQSLELDFFKRALRQVEASRRPSTKRSNVSGETGSGRRTIWNAHPPESPAPAGN